MFKHILLPTDGSELSQKAADKAIALAKALDATITAVNVIAGHQFQFVDDGFAVLDVAAVEERVNEIETNRASAILELVKQSAGQAGVACDTVARVGSCPYLAIIEQAKKLGCDLIVMASHGRKGLPGLLLGSETVKVLTHSTVPVLVCR
jgi:nucleotide-binding universal stress UspA family protein